MRKVLKSLIIVGLLCGLLSVTVFAGNVGFSKFGVKNTGYTYNATGSYNTKATTGASWFIQVTNISFDRANIAGTLGMAHAPCIGTDLRGNDFWTKVSSTNWTYLGWRSGYGGSGITYQLCVRLDSLINVGSNYIYTVGNWNSN